MLEVDVTKDLWDYVGIVVDAVAAIATVVTVVFASRELKNGRDREQEARTAAQAAARRERLSKRGAQARSVGHYLRWTASDEQPGTGDLSLVIVNASALPITQIEVEMAAPWEFAPGAATAPFPEGAVAPGATRTATWRVPIPATASRSDGPELRVTFRDNAGRNWCREPSGDVQWAPGGRPLDGD